MSDPDETAPDEAPRSERETLDRAVSEVRERRSSPPPADAPEPTEAPATKLSDDKQDPLSPRQGGRLLSQLRRDEAARAAAYAASADGALREVDRRLAAASVDPRAAEGIKRAAAELVNSFGDVRTQDDLARLRETDASRAARFDYLDGVLKSGVPDGQLVDPDLTAQSEAARLETERRQLAQEREVASRISTLEGVERDLATKLQHALPHFHEQFADIKSLADVEAMQRQDPARFAQFSQYSAALANGMAQLEALGKERFTTAKASFDQQAEAHDSYFSQAHPELSDRWRATEVGDAVRQLLSHLGIGKDELEPLWDGRQTFSLRDFRAQELLYKAAMWELGQSKFAEARANGRGKDLPPVQRPGQRVDRSESLHAQAEAASRRFDRDPSLKNAVKQLQAQRATRR